MWAEACSGHLPKHCQVRTGTFSLYEKLKSVQNPTGQSCPCSVLPISGEIVQELGMSLQPCGRPHIPDGFLAQT